MSPSRSGARSALLFRVGAPEPERVDRDPLARPATDEELLWVDIDPGHGEGELQRTLEQLGIATALDDLPENDRPFVRFRDQALVIQVLAIVDPGDEVDWAPLLLIAAPNTVISVHRGRVPHVAAPVRVFAADPRFGRLDAGTFAGLLMDGVIDGYFGEVEQIEKVIDDLDEHALRDRDVGSLLDELVVVRGRIATLRRMISPHREVFAALSRPSGSEAEPSPIGWPWPGLPARLERALDAVEHAREQLVGTFDLVTTRTGEHTNDVMRVLTVISAVLLPSVVIAGVMGMNFKQPMFDDPGNFLWVLAAMVGLALGILGFARWRQWL